MKREMTRGAVGLKAWRESRSPKKSQHQLAVALDAKSVFTISKWERGVQVPTVAEAVEIERYTGGAVPVAWWAEAPRKAKARGLQERDTERVA